MSVPEVEVDAGSAGDGRGVGLNGVCVMLCDVFFFDKFIEPLRVREHV